MKKAVFLILIGIILCTYSNLNNCVFAQQTQEIPDSIAGLLDDGPYVYWQQPTSAIVFYNCAGEIIRKEFENTDTVRFDGFCSDSNITYILPVQAPSIEPFVYEGVSEIFAISDIHGEYDIFKDILLNSGVIDENLHWNWGNGHLVVVGDVFDRGAKVTECLWLIYSLEQEARKKGGRVHFLLGNHELLVLRGDLRYVHKKYIKGIARKTRISCDDLFGPDMELGRWLRTKHTVIKLNDILFVHAGISPDIIHRNLSMEYINEQVRNNIDARSTKVAFDEELKFLYKSNGPFWYRGYFEDEDYIRLTQNQVEEIQDYFDVSALVIGHTGVDQVESMYNRRVFAIDIPFESLFCFQALLYKNDTFYRVYGSGEIEKLH